MEQKNLSLGVADQVERMISTGRLRIGERVNEVHLADRLGVSRTPLREGLTRLAEAGVLTTRARRGFFVPDFDARAVADLYEVRAIVDPAALRAAGLPTGDQLDRMTRLNERLARAGSAQQAVELDNRWHRTLLDHCENRELTALISRYMDRTRVFELELCRRSARIETMTEEHAEVMESLAEHDLEEAAIALAKNLRKAAVYLEGVLDPSRAPS